MTDIYQQVAEALKGLPKMVRNKSETITNALLDAALLPDDAWHHYDIVATPGGITTEDEIAPGVTAYRNTNGNIVSLSIDLSIAERIIQ